MRFGVQLRQMRKNKRLNFDNVSLETKFFRRKSLRGGFVRKKWVPRRNRFAVKRKFNRASASHQTVKDSRKMIPDVFRTSQKSVFIGVVLRGRFRGQPIKFFPDDNSSLFRVGEFFRQLRREWGWRS